MQDRSDWTRVDALTDEEIDRAIADDPDAAPVVHEGFLEVTWDLSSDGRVAMCWVEI